MLNKKALTTWYIIVYIRSVRRNCQSSGRLVSRQIKNPMRRCTRHHTYKLVASSPIWNIRVRLRVARERSDPARVLGVSMPATRSGDTMSVLKQAVDSPGRPPLSQGCTNQRWLVRAEFEACCGPQACCHGLAWRFCQLSDLDGRSESAPFGICGVRDVSCVKIRGLFGHGVGWT
jgi:hypothetical protein